MANPPRTKKTPEERAAATGPRRARKTARVEAEAGSAPVAAGPARAESTAGPVLRKKDLLDRVHAQGSAKKADVKAIIDATLTVIGEALAKGEGLNLPPLGKAKVNRTKDTKMGEMFVIKLHRGGDKAASADESDQEPLAADAK